MPVTVPLQEPWSISRNAEMLAFPCPHCRVSLTLPAELACAQGPCPLCHEIIVGPDPARGLAARIAAPEDVETSEISCGACAALLQVDAAATVSSGPCPACGTWIQLDGQPLTPASHSEPTLDFPDLEASWDEAGGDRFFFDESPAEPAASPRNRARAPEAGNEEVERSGAWEPDSRQPWSSPAPELRALPFAEPALSEVEVGEARAQVPSRQFSARRSTRLFWWPIAAVTLLSVAVLGAVALRFELLDWQGARLWERLLPISATPSSGEEVPAAAVERSTGPALHESMERHARSLAVREAQSFEAARLALERFLSAPTWSAAQEELLIAFPSSRQETLASLQDFPRESLLGRSFELLESKQRIAGTERHVFPLRLVPLDGASERPLFVLLEESEEGRYHIHAEHLLQNWRETLSHFLKTPGSPGGSFYVWIALGKGLLADETAIVLPPDDFTKVRLLDYFSRNNQWQGTGYVKTASPAGIVLRSKINETQWRAALLDLRWKKTTQGDAFIEVESLVPSNWGDFAK